MGYNESVLYTIVCTQYDMISEAKVIRRFSANRVKSVCRRYMSTTVNLLVFIIIIVIVRWFVFFYLFYSGAYYMCAVRRLTMHKFRKGKKNDSICLGAFTMGHAVMRHRRTQPNIN